MPHPKTSVVLLLCFLSLVLYYFINSYEMSSSKFLGLSGEIIEPDVGMLLRNIRLVEKEGNKTLIDVLSSSAVLREASNLVELVDVMALINSNDNRREPVAVLADKGTIDRKKHKIFLSGDTLVNFDEGAYLSTDSLIWDSREKNFSTDDFVIINGDSFLLTGKGMVFKTNPQNIRLKKDVAALFY